MARASDVAALLVEKLGSVPSIKLQKLLYYSQGWHLAWEAVPLFPEAIQAWANGPLVRDIYDQHRGRFVLDHPWPANGNPDRLTRDEKESVEIVLEMYGDWTARQLALAAHSERPWNEARFGLVPGSREDTEMDLEVMLDYFTGIYADLVEQPRTGTV